MEKSGRFVIEVVFVRGRPEKGWVCERPLGRFYFTPHFKEATIYGSNLDADIARCYVKDEHQPTVVKLMDPSRN